MLENKKCQIINKILNTPYNFSLVLLTIIIWYIFCYVPFANAGYDRANSMFSYIIFFSGGSVIASYVKQKQEALDQVGICATASMLLSMMSLLLCKSIGLWEVVHYGVMWLLVPSSIFVFLLLVKTIVIGSKC
ncbi:MAG: hypothetical protein ACEY3D_00110 [Rickettsia sp.]|uniref:hypothetical protein n=1 Tax=Rickettsia sp. TaxID=789 RepID=UPI003978AF54